MLPEDGSMVLSAARAVCGFFAGRAGAIWLGEAAPRWWCETGCAIGFAALPAAGHGTFLGYAAGAVAVWWLVCLAVADLAVRLLPNALTLTGASAALACAAVVGRGAAALVGALCFAGAYFLVHLASPRSMGAGDVKLALCAAVQPSAVLSVMLLSLLISALAAMAVLIRRGRSPPGTVAHGASKCLAGCVVLALARI